jgi:hypothetical protein
MILHIKLNNYCCVQRRTSRYTLSVFFPSVCLVALSNLLRALLLSLFVWSGHLSVCLSVCLSTVCQRETTDNMNSLFGKSFWTDRLERPLPGFFPLLGFLRLSVNHLCVCTFFGVVLCILCASTFFKYFRPSVCHLCVYVFFKLKASAPQKNVMVEVLGRRRTTDDRQIERRMNSTYIYWVSNIIDPGWRGELRLASFIKHKH